MLFRPIISRKLFQSTRTRTYSSPVLASRTETALGVAAAAPFVFGGVLGFFAGMDEAYKSARRTDPDDVVATAALYSIICVPIATLVGTVAGGAYIYAFPFMYLYSLTQKQ